ncbi:MAG: hypothetical protein M3R20_00985, partial [Pseudomonadota bacterium]|nr:hypothetical protein [Pseudomonadota bacterium]
MLGLIRIMMSRAGDAWIRPGTGIYRFGAKESSSSDVYTPVPPLRRAACLRSRRFQTALTEKIDHDNFFESIPVMQRMVKKKAHYNVAIAGATGAVGEALLSILGERKFPVGELTPLASARSAGGRLSFGGRQMTVRDLATFDFAGIDIAFFSAGGKVSREHAPR